VEVPDGVRPGSARSAALSVTQIRRHGPRPIANGFGNLWSKVTTADAYPASFCGLIDRRRDPRWIFARFHLNGAKALAKTMPVQTPGSETERPFRHLPPIDCNSRLGLLILSLEEGERNTLLSRRFPGGSLKIVASKAPRNLRRHTARVLIVDEADAMEVGAEGNPIRLGERRTMTFANRKIIIGSTPIFEDTSHVLRAYGESDRRVFEVPCPSCGAFTEIMWQHIVWPEGKPDEARFKCPHCNESIEERFKAGMVRQGQWRVTQPE